MGLAMGEGSSEVTFEVIFGREDEGIEEKLGNSAVSEDLGGTLGAVNVKEDCLSTTFSFRSRVSKSRRFSFSFSACSFLASSSATLSSSYVLTVSDKFR